MNNNRHCNLSNRDVGSSSSFSGWCVTDSQQQQYSWWSSKLSVVSVRSIASAIAECFMQPTDGRSAPCSSDYRYSSHKYWRPVSTSQRWLLLLQPTDGRSAPYVGSYRYPSHKYQWPVSTSQRWLEAAKIRNGHRKVQSLYENK